MRIQSVHIHNFKGIEDLAIDLVSQNTGRPRQFTALVGHNGSGKTSVLQAIALTMALATKQIRSPEDFGWHGFVPARLSNLGETRVELKVAFDPAEITAVSEIFETWLDSRDEEWLQQNPVTRPGDAENATLVLENGRVRCVEGRAEYNQFLGRYYIKVLTHTHPRLRARFKDVGDVFWFDHYRNLGSLRYDNSGRDKQPGPGATEAGLERLRKFLVSMWGYHASEEKAGNKDYVVEMDRMLDQLIPGMKFHGVEPRPSSGRNQDSRTVRSDFMLMEKDGKTFDIAEMSSGEQALFPLVYEFVRLDIARSIVLLDELELHLHPVEQKRLLAALPTMGKDCQFIISTHSPYLEEIITIDDQVRLGGDLWNM